MRLSQQGMHGRRSMMRGGYKHIAFTLAAGSHCSTLDSRMHFKLYCFSAQQAQMKR